VAVAAAVPARAGAQALSLYRQHEGPIDYVVAGNSFRTESNTGNACAVGTTSTATLTIPNGATVVAAYLYWAGSGNLDNTVTLSRAGVGSVDLTADGTFTDPFPYNNTTLNYFGGYDDVTASVIAGGSGSYTVSNLTVDVDAPFCGVEGVVKGWALMVIYRQTGLPIKRIQLRHGLSAFRQANEHVDLANFLASNTPDARVTFLLYEGDPNLSGSEQLLFNGGPFSDGLNPLGNVFNSTVNTPSPGRTNVHGMDLDTYNASALFAPRARTATVDLGTGDDMAILQVILTSLSVALADVTPDGLPAAEQRLPGRSSRVFQVENPSLATDNYDLLARFTGTPGYLQIDSVTGTGVTRGARADSARVQIAAGATRSVTVWYTVTQAISGLQNLLHLRARSVTYPTTPAAQDTGYTQVLGVRPQLTLTKQVSPQGTFAPGTELTYSMQFSNVGSFGAQGVVVSDSVPPQVLFKTGTVTQTLPAGITAAVEYSNNAGTTWTYVPVSAGCGAPAGFDGCVRRIRWRLLGTLAAGAASSTGSVQFVARIK